MDRLERAWAAGFFDGEGWAAAVVQRGRRTAQPMAQINQGGPAGVPEVLVRFRNAVGVGTISGPEVEPGKEDLYRWTVSSRGDVTQTWRSIEPWLCSTKAGQLTTALGAAESCRERGTAQEELAWAAGFFDGEGSTYLVPHRKHADRYYVESAITQLAAGPPCEELERFSAAVGGLGRIYGPYVQDGALELVFRWKAVADGIAAAVLRHIWTWLGTRKRRQAEAALSVVAAQQPLPRGNPAWGNRRTHCVHGHEYATARIRPFKPRKGGTERRASKQCLACVREWHRRAHARRKMQEPGCRYLLK